MIVQGKVGVHYISSFIIDCLIFWDLKVFFYKNNKASKIVFIIKWLGKKIWINKMHIASLK